MTDVFCVQSNSKTDWMTIFYYYYIKYTIPDSLIIECGDNRKYLEELRERNLRISV